LSRALSLVLLALAASSVAFAQTPPAPPPTPAPADSAFHEFLRQLSDSTSDYFGRSAQPIDTTGLDSVLARRLAGIDPTRPFPMPSVLPDFRFNRVDGPVYGLAVNMGERRWMGEASAHVDYAAGPNEWLWRTRYEKAFGRRGREWEIDALGGVMTMSMDRERESRRLATLRALVFGTDSQNYLRQEGWTLAVRRVHPVATVGVRYRDNVDKPLQTTASWNLLDNDLRRFDNLQATYGRAHEFEFAVVADAHPLLPVHAEVIHQTSGDAIGSDFETRRTRVAVSGDIGVGRSWSFVPQAAYGRLNGDPIPQAAFFIGGSRSMRSLSTGDRAGTAFSFGRLELIGTRDILEVLRIPHPAFLPLQLDLFTGVGAVWGDDPYGGPPRGGVDWPDEEHWVSEAGFAIVYQPGFPDPLMLLRMTYAVPLGPEREANRFSITLSSALDALRTFMP
jgi:hypothetical protein